MKRTVKRIARPLNRGKELALLSLTAAYARQKDVYVVELAKAKNWHLWEASRLKQRKFRDQHSLHVLPVHCDDQCLFDAIDTLKRWIESTRALKRWNAAVYRASRDESTRIRRYRILKSYAAMADVLRGRTQDAFLFHLLTHTLGNAPRVRQMRTVVLDDTLYDVQEENGRQFIAVTGLEKRKRIRIPLLGRSRISGTIRLVRAEDHWEIHSTFELAKKKAPKIEQVVGLDAGITEVFTDSRGQRYGTEFGT